LLDDARTVRPPPGLPLEPTIVDVAGVPVAYGAASGSRRWVRIPDLAELSWTAESDALEVTPYPDADHELVLDEVHAIGIPLFLHAARGYEAIHASAVASTSGVVGFCGASGSGKSTIAQALAFRGSRLWADDVLALQVDGQRVIATALPFRPKARPESEAFFRRSADQASSDTHQPIAEQWSTEHLQALFVLDAIEPARDSNNRVPPTKLNAADAIAALLPHGFRCLPLEEGRERQILMSYVGLVASVPVFTLKYTRRFEDLPALLDEVEAVIRTADSALASGSS
jgi:hypothetical protein